MDPKLFDRRWVLIGLFAFLFFDVLSLMAYTLPAVNWFALAVIGIGTGILVYRDSRFALVLPLAELFWGSFGAGLFWELGDVRVTLRMVLFIVCLALFWIKVLIGTQRFSYSFSQPEVWLYVLLLSAVSWGFIVGAARGNAPLAIYHDGNAYLFLLYAPVWASIFKPGDERLVGSLLASAAVGLAEKTLLFFHVIAHDYALLNVPYLYLWIRDTRVGEITQVGDSIFRVFIQSQLFIGIAMLQLLVIWAWRAQRSWSLFFTWVTLAAAMVVSMSRSFWFGFAATLAVLIVATQRLIRQHLKPVLYALGFATGGTLGALFLVGLLVALPYGRFGFSEALLGRLSAGSDAASSSRVQQLSPLFARISERPLSGSGYGALVSYVTNDPRARAMHPDGLVTTYAFEWGYLDQWLKLGAVALVGFAAVLFGQMVLGLRYALRNPEAQLPILLLLSGLLFIMAVHTVSPYLNHPLGLGYLSLTMAVLHNYHRTYEFSHR